MRLFYISLAIAVSPAKAPKNWAGMTTREDESPERSLLRCLCVSVLGMCQMTVPL